MIHDSGRQYSNYLEDRLTRNDVTMGLTWKMRKNAENCNFSALGGFFLRRNKNDKSVWYGKRAGKLFNAGFINKN